MGLDDWFGFALRYWQSFVLLFLSTGIAAFLALRTRRRNFRLLIVLSPMVATVAVCALHLAFTAKQNITLTLLGAEDDSAAEQAYRTFATKIELDEAIQLARATDEDANVRFYAACAAADILATRDPWTLTEILRRVSNAPPLEPRFFSTNTVNASFYSPGSRFAVSEVIERRLQDIIRAKGH